MSDSTSPRNGLRLYWITTGVAAAAFAIPGAANLLRVPHVAHDMAHLGFPDYFMSILGTWKILAAIAVLVPRLPRLKELAYAGMIFDLSGAAISRMVVKDGPVFAVIPLCIGAVVVTSWALRPPGRKLGIRSADDN